MCIDASRVYDSCGDKDCLEDLRVYFSPASQAVIDQAAQVRMRNVDVLVVYLGLEPVPFHKGFYSVDMTFFFEVTLDCLLYTSSDSAYIYRRGTHTISQATLKNPDDSTCEQND